MFRKWKESRGGQAYEEYIRAWNKARKAYRSRQKNLEKTVASVAKLNPKTFWSNATRSGVADLKMQDDTKTTLDGEKAEFLNLFFQSVFTVEEKGNLPKLQDNI